MAETIHEFSATLPAPRGGSFVPRACGRLMDDGKRWEGWIESVPADAGAALRTERATVQPSRDHLEYWATGLSMTYLEGALVRAGAPRRVHESMPPASEPEYGQPAPDSVVTRLASKSATARPRAILDPFRV